MVDIEHANAYTEVLEIIKFISKEDYDKIPKENIEALETFSNKEHEFKYNPEKTLDEQNVSNITKVLIAILFRDYWATDNQRKHIIAKQNENRKRIEEEKREKYNPNNIFNKNQPYKEVEDKQTTEEIALTEIREIKWYEKIILSIKKIFRK